MEAAAPYWVRVVNFCNQLRFSLVAASFMRNWGTTNACSTVG
jgi:hypothetical protein